MEINHVLIVEDDKEIREGVQIYLQSQGYKVFQAADGIEGLEVLEREEIHLAIIDIMMPRMDGIRMTMKLREKYDFPVIMLSAKSEEVDKITGLNIGADDYVTKPFSLMALRLRVNNLLSRALAGKPCDVPNRYEKHGLLFDFDNLIFKKNDMEIELSKTEIRLLKYFTENEGITLSREKLIDYVWQNQQYVDENALSVSVKRLRDKIEGSGEKIIHTVYGIGYVFKWEE